MKKEISDLLEVSRYFGQNKEYVLAGGGNTSYKDRESIWIKASGIALADITEDGFVCLSRELLQEIGKKNYSSDSVIREQEVKEDLAKAIIAPKHLRPSVETSLHEIIPHPYIVHTHPTLVNALMCGVNARELTGEFFGQEALFIEYTDPGYILFKKVRERRLSFEAKHGFSPKIIFLQNHGIFVGGDTIDDIKRTYSKVESSLKEKITGDSFDSEISSVDSPYLEASSEYFNPKSLRVSAFSSELIRHFSNSKQFKKIARPFTPDIIVYCKSNYLFLEQETEAASMHVEIDHFKDRFAYYPKVIIIENESMLIVEDREENIRKVAEVFVDMMKISLLSENFGGPCSMAAEQIDFIENWEVENYRRKVSKEGK